MKNTIITYITLLTSVFCLSINAQMEERGLARNGNDFLKDSLFVMAEAEYLKSLDIHDFDTNRFNMAFAMLGQEKFEDAITEWESVEKSSDNKILKSFCVYNIGGALAMQQKTDDALEKYKQALRYFPKNDVARHNYWFLKLVKDQNPQQQQQDQDNKDKDNKDKQDQNKDQQDQDQENQDQEKSDDNSEQGDQKEDSKDGESDDDKSDEEKEKDGESEEDSKDDKSDEEEKEDGKSDEESDKDADDKKDENGDSEDEQEGDKEGESQGEELKEGELSTGDALRLLESLDKEEDKTQEKIKAKLLKGKKKKKHEKDW